MSGVPKLHGWITPEYAMKIMDDLEEWLESEIVKKYFEETDPVYIGPETEECLSMTTNAHNAT